MFTFSEVGDGTTDLTEVMQAFVNDHERLHFPAGVYRITNSVFIPTVRHITADPGAIIYHDGVITGDMAGYSAFVLRDATYKVTIDGLTFRGNHAGGWTNAQMAFVDLLGTQCDTCTFRNMRFENGVGFSIHNAGGGLNVTVENVRTENCGNGLNVNATHSRFSNIHINNSEGIEASGAYTVIEDIYITNALAVGVSLGGDMSGNYLPGIVLRRFTINGVTESSANGLVIADGCDGAIIEDGDIRLTRGIGIVTAVSGAGRARNNTIRRVTLQDNYNVAIFLSHDADLTGTTVEDCVVLPNASEDANYRTNFGARIAEAGAVVRGNDLRDAGVLFDVSYAETAVGATNEDNEFVTLQDER